MNRRNFIKALTIVPFIDWGKPVRFKVQTETGLTYKKYLELCDSHWYLSPRLNGIIDNIEIPEGY